MVPVDPVNTSLVKDYESDSIMLDDNTFAARHGGAFLLLSGSNDILQQPTGPRQTVTGLEAKKAIRFSKPYTEFSVFPVRQTGRSSMANSITVGRNQNNDVVISDVSLSKFHAVFRQTADGAYQLMDAGSKNGSFLNEKVVPSRGQGDAVVVRSGDRVRFGSIELTFLVAADFRLMVKKLFSG